MRNDARGYKLERTKWQTTFYLDGQELEQFRNYDSTQQAIREICIDYTAKLVRHIEFEHRPETRYLLVSKGKIE